MLGIHHPRKKESKKERSAVVSYPGSWRGTIAPGAKFFGFREP